MYSDLMYNRTNMRDVHKPKEMSRMEYRIEKSTKTDDKEHKNSINEYYVRKAMNQVRKIEKCSEVHDAWGLGEATQVHHIFPKHDYPMLSATVENMIMLTATQHIRRITPNKSILIISEYACYQKRIQLMIQYKRTANRFIGKSLLSMW